MQLPASSVLRNVQAISGEEPRYMWGELRYSDTIGERDGFRYEVVDAVGGVGQGDHAHVVIKVTDTATGEAQYFRKSGFYSSYEGFTWDGDFYEVKPQEKVITVYEEAVEGNKLDAYDIDWYNSYDDESSYL